MRFKIAPALLALTLLASLAPDAGAQAAYNSQGATGNFGRSTATTNNLSRGLSFATGNQRLGLPLSGLGGTAGIYGPRGRNGLPVCSMDSFVMNAQGHADHIYGDEGADSLPPYQEFTKVHRINTGINGARDAGLTTGHGSYLPDAWGGDEWVDGPEFSRSGSNGGNPGWSTPGPVGLVQGSGGGGGANGGQQQQQVQLPYTPGSDWAAVTNSHNGQIMGYMAPGETWQDFFSGASGHLLPGNAAEGAYILQNQIQNPGGSPWTGGW